MDESIRIVLKPDSVSWEEIHHVLWMAHSENRIKGIVNAAPSYTGKELAQIIGDDGKLLVALNQDGSVVGVNGYRPDTVSFGFGKLRVASRHFAAVLPAYNGMGVYREMCRVQEQMAESEGLHIMLLDTHEKNEHLLHISMKAGYVPVDIRIFDDHTNIVLAKWLEGCPFPSWRIKLNFWRRKVRKIAGKIRHSVLSSH